MYRGGSEIIPSIRYLNMICTQITYSYHYYYYYYYCGGGGGSTAHIPATYGHRARFLFYILQYLLNGIKLAVGKKNKSAAAVL